MPEDTQENLRHSLPEGAKWFHPGAADSINPGVIEEFRANGGVVGGAYATLPPVLVLHTVGAKSGEPRVNPLCYVEHEGRWFLGGSYGGSPKAPAWAHNLRANPKVTVELGQEGEVRSFDVTAVELSGAERDEIWAVLIERSPGFAEYQSETSRVIPVFELVR